MKDFFGLFAITKHYKELLLKDDPVSIHHKNTQALATEMNKIQK